MRLSTYKVLIRGRVQGVGYRWFAREAARELGLTGTVKNMPDGSVYICVQGDQQAIFKFISQLRKGPSFSTVIDVDISEVNEDAQFSTFQII